MASTIRELIESLSTLDQDQVYVGNLFIAGDFTFQDDEFQEIQFTPEELAEVAEYRSVYKSVEYFYDEVLELLVANKEKTDE